MKKINGIGRFSDLLKRAGLANSQTNTLLLYLKMRRIGSETPVTYVCLYYFFGISVKSTYRYGFPGLI